MILPRIDSATLRARRISVQRIFSHSVALASCPPRSEAIISGAIVLHRPFSFAYSLKFEGTTPKIGANGTARCTVYGSHPSPSCSTPASRRCQLRGHVTTNRDRRTWSRCGQRCACNADKYAVSYSGSGPGLLLAFWSDTLGRGRPARPANWRA